MITISNVPDNDQDYSQNDFSATELNTGSEDDNYSNNDLNDDESDNDFDDDEDALSGGQDTTTELDTDEDDDSDVDEDDAVNADVSEYPSSQQPKGKPVYIKDMPPIDGAIRQGGI